MASAKTLIRTGVSLATRFLNPNLNPSHQIIPRIPDLVPSSKFLPHLYIPQFHNTTPLHFLLQRNDAESVKNLSCEGFLYPPCLPSLPFFLPDDWRGDLFGAFAQKGLPRIEIIYNRDREKIRLVSLCFCYQNGLISQAIYDAKGIMDSLLEKRRKVAEELLLGELQKVGSESQHNDSSNASVISISHTAYGRLLLPIA